MNGTNFKLITMCGHCIAGFYCTYNLSRILKTRHDFPQMQLSAKIKSAAFIISITRNALKEEMEALLSSYVLYMATTFIKTFWTPVIGKELTCII